MNRNLTFLLLAIASATFYPQFISGQTKATFESLFDGPNAVWNGAPASYGSYKTEVEDSVFRFTNYFTRTDYGFGLYESWTGMAFSKAKDDTTAAFSNQYSAITAGGAFGSDNYAVFYTGYHPDTIKLTKRMLLDSVFITNGTYPYLSMKNGDMFAKKFGGESGNDEDWFLLSIYGMVDDTISDTVNVYLADYRFADNNNDYVLNTWKKVDLSALDSVDGLVLNLTSSDVGSYGMNTPAFFCMDNLCGVTFDSLKFTSGDYWNGKDACYGSYSSTMQNGPATFSNNFSLNDYGYGSMETWSNFAFSSMQNDTTPGYYNQYSAYPATGANGSNAYGVCFNQSGRDTIKLDSSMVIAGMFVTNGTYPYLSMRDGDMFAKKFGGQDGSSPDWFLLTIRGIYKGAYTDSIDFYLADYRPANSEDDYIVSDWEFVDFSPLGKVDMIELSLSSSDVGAYGMNTPAYFFFDDFNDHGPELIEPIADVFVALNELDITIDLSTYFTDIDDPDTGIIYSICENTNPELVQTTITKQELRLSFTPDMEGGDTLVVKALSNGQFVNDTVIVQVNPIGIKALEHNNLADIKVYPNPTQGNFQISTNTQKPLTIEIYNGMGQKIYKTASIAGNAFINMDSQPAGVYVLKVSNSKTSVLKRIVKN